MERDPDQTMSAMRRAYAEVVRPTIRSYGGRVVKLTGDGALAEFGSAGSGIGAALAIQTALAGHDLRLRAGLEVGDVTDEGGDVFGDAVNIASRLQALAEPGGGLVSRAAADMAGGAVRGVLRPDGTRRLNNIARPVATMAIDLAWRACSVTPEACAAAQVVRFATSADGTRRAYAIVGAGRPIVKAPNWIQHIEADWRMPNAGAIASLSAMGRLVRFDARGNGLSDWDIGEFSLERFVEDLEAVWAAAQVDRAPIFAISQGGAIAASFAARHPERVSGLVCVGSFAQGRARRAGTADAKLKVTLSTLAAAGWNDPYPSLRDYLAQLIYPDLGQDEQRGFAEVMRTIITPENFARMRKAIDQFDVTGVLDKVVCPALVLHAANDRMQPVEVGRRFAAGLRNARFVTLPGANHVPVDRDPGWAVAEREIAAFLAGLE